MSFLKRLFGGGSRHPSPGNTTVSHSDDDIVGLARAQVANFDRRAQPQEWAQAMQMLGNNLMVTGQYPEAETVLIAALEVAGPASDKLFRASMTKILGETRYRHGETLTGDTRGHKLAEAANNLADALTLVEPHENRALWFEAATFRGAALHELGRLSPGRDGLAWMDDAAACFAEIARHGSETGTHPIGFYNRYAVLEQRGHRTEGRARSSYYREARAALAAAMESETFADRPDLTVKLAELEALIDAAD